MYGSLCLFFATVKSNEQTAKLMKQIGSIEMTAPRFFPGSSALLYIFSSLIDGQNSRSFAILSTISQKHAPPSCKLWEVARELKTNNTAGH